MVRFIVGIALALAAVLAAYLIEGGGPFAILGLSAFVITFFVPLFGVLAVWTFREWTRAWSHAFRKAPTPAEARISVEVWKFSEFVCFLAGVLGTLVGSILIFGAFDVVQAHGFRPFGALMIAPLYGTFFGFVCRVLRFRVENLNPAL